MPLEALLTSLAYTVVMAVIFTLVRMNIRKMAPIRHAYLEPYRRADPLTRAMRVQGDFDPNEPEDARGLGFLASLVGGGILIWISLTKGLGMPQEAVGWWLFLTWIIGTLLAFGVSWKLIDTKELLPTH